VNVHEPEDQREVTAAVLASVHGFLGGPTREGDEWPFRALRVAEVASMSTLGDVSDGEAGKGPPSPPTQARSRRSDTLPRMMSSHERRVSYPVAEVGGPHVVASSASVLVHQDG